MDIKLKSFLFLRGLFLFLFYLPFFFISFSDSLAAKPSKSDKYIKNHGVKKVKKKKSFSSKSQNHLKKKSLVKKKLINKASKKQLPKNKKILQKKHNKILKKDNSAQDFNKTIIISQSAASADFANNIPEPKEEINKSPIYSSYNLVKDDFYSNQKIFDTDEFINKNSVIKENKYKIDPITFDEKFYNSKIFKKKKTFDTKFSDEDLSIFQVNIGNYLILTNGIVSYKSDKTIFLPLVEFVNILGFHINKSDGDPKKIEGWFINESNKFNFDFVNKEVTSSKKKYNLSPDHIRIVEEEVFVDTESLEKWFPIKISFNSLEQLILITSLQPLPVEEAAERDKKWDKMEEDKAVHSQMEYVPLLKTPYRAWSTPLIDIRYGYEHNESPTKVDTTSKLDVLASGDFLYVGHQLVTNFTDSKISNARLTSGRTDPEGKLLGPLQATSFSFGDVYTPDVPLLSIPQTGKGFNISSLPPEYIADDNVSINGVMNPGWDAEIYRNDILLDFKKVSEDGRYEFQNIPLNTGLNIIKIVFYGPYGQKKEEIRRFMLNEGLIKKGQFYYNFSTNKNNENLIKVDSDIIGSNPKSDPKYGASRRFGELIYGLTRNTSISANFASIPISGVDQQQHDYQGGSLRTSLFGVYGRYDITRDTIGKNGATEASLQTNIWDVDINYKRNDYDKDFTSETHQFSTNQLIDKTTIKINSPISIPYLSNRLYMMLSNSKEHYYLRESRYFTEGELSFPFGMLNITQNIQSLYDETISEGSRRTANGKTFFNLRVNNYLTLRGTLFYNMKPKYGLTSTSESITYNFSNDFSLNLNHTYQLPQPALGQESSTNYSGSISKSFEKFILSLGGNYADSGSFGVNLNLTMSLGYNPKYGAGVISKAPISEKGAVAVRVFLDDNGNDVYDKGEQLLDGVEFNAAGLNAKTNKKGVAMIGQFSTTSPTLIKMDTAGIADPYWIPKKTSYNVIAHSGSILEIDFPVSPTGDINGYARISDEDGYNVANASNVILELLDRDGNIVKTAKSSFDGFYIFEGIPFGKYKLRISIEQSQRLGLFSKVVYDVELNKDKQSIAGFNFLIFKDTNIASQNSSNSEEKKNIFTENYSLETLVLEHFIYTKIDTISFEDQSELYFSVIPDSSTRSIDYEEFTEFHPERYLNKIEEIKINKVTSVDSISESKPDQIESGILDSLIEVQLTTNELDDSLESHFNSKNNPSKDLQNLFHEERQSSIKEEIKILEENPNLTLDQYQIKQVELEPMIDLTLDNFEEIIGSVINEKIIPEEVKKTKVRKVVKNNKKIKNKRNKKRNKKKPN